MKTDLIIEGLERIAQQKAAYGCNTPMEYEDSQKLFDKVYLIRDFIKLISDDQDLKDFFNRIGE